MTEDVLNWIKKEKLMTEGDTVIVGLGGTFTRAFGTAPEDRLYTSGNSCGTWDPW